ncbi:vacuolar protein sorting-associated protein 33B-like [Tropilaelaps mercedesae]|uniref:Vacuolar protein sorting-associated protein 33B-like n=1 Tax=Tropilaelaps mercedesae TaxID=418985 RepID=A0A1V9XP80_9ACAR|nr:vacuolar protein sorting-associated protein 33B-like [Tropilaelaps mercedesae]
MATSSMCDYIQHYAETALIKTLENIVGPKDLLIETSLIKSMDNIASITKLRATGVAKIFKLESALPPNSSKKCVFIAKSKLSSIKQVCTILASNAHGREFYLLALPRLTPVCLALLEAEGVFGLINVIPLPSCKIAFVQKVTLLLVDEDVASLEENAFFKDVFVHEDTSLLTSVALSLCQMEEFAKIRQVTMLGEQSHSVWRQWGMLRRGRGPSTHKFFIDQLILFDRDMDLASLMATQMNYTAILDDLFGIENGKCIIPKAVTRKEERQINLRDACDTFAAIKDKHVSAAFGVLSSESKKLVTNTDVSTPQSISGMKHFVNVEVKAIAKIRNSLSLHISVCEEISLRRGQNFDIVRAVEQNLLQGVELKQSIEMIKESICSGKSWEVCLRLICLLSLANDGVPSGYLEPLRTAFLHQFGFHHLSVLQALEKLGVLHEAAPVITTSQSKGGSMINKMATSANFLGLKESAFMARARRLGLSRSASGNGSGGRSHSASFVFNDLYVPLVVKLVEAVYQGTLENFIKTSGRRHESIDSRAYGELANRTRFEFTSSSTKNTKLEYPDLVLWSYYRMAPLAKLRLRAGFGSNKHITGRRRSNEFEDFDRIECPNTFDDDPSVDEFFEQRNAEGSMAGLIKTCQKPPLALEKQKISPKNQMIALKPIIRSSTKINYSKNFLDKPDKAHLGCSLTNKGPASVPPAQEATTGKHRTIAVSFAESARKGIQKRSQSIREKIMPRRLPAVAKALPAVAPGQQEVQVEDKNPAEMPPMTPVAPLARPRVPPKTRNKRLGPTPTTTANTLVNPQCITKDLIDAAPKQATHGYRVVAQPTICRQRMLSKRHVWGRWSLPMATSLVEPIDPEEEGGRVNVTPLYVNPVRARKKIVPQKSGGKGALPPPSTSMMRTSSMVEITPKRKKSLVRGVRIQFNHRDSLRKLSLRKTVVVVGANPVLPSKKKSAAGKSRNPYAHIKSKVGEVFRSVIPKRAAAPNKCLEVKSQLNTSKLNSTTSSSIANSSTTSAASLSTAGRRIPSRARQSPSATSPLAGTGAGNAFRNPNPPGKTLAQLVRDFHRTPPRFRSRPADKSSGKKTIL